MPNVTKCCIRRSASQTKNINIEINNERQLPLLKEVSRKYLYLMGRFNWGLLIVHPLWIRYWSEVGGHVVWLELLSRNRVFNNFHPNSIPASRGWSVFEWSRWPCSISRGLCVKINYKINQRPPPAPANCTKAGFTAYSQKLVPNQIKQPAARRETKYSKLGVTTRQNFGRC